MEGHLSWVITHVCTVLFLSDLHASFSPIHALMLSVHGALGLPCLFHPPPFPTTFPYSRHSLFILCFTSQKPLFISLSVCLSLSRTVYLSGPMFSSISLALYYPMSLWPYISLYLFGPVFPSISLVLYFPLSLWPDISLYLSLSFYLPSPSLYLPMTFPSLFSFSQHYPPLSLTLSISSPSR